jgi:hypothetical protein
MEDTETIERISLITLGRAEMEVPCPSCRVFLLHVVIPNLQLEWLVAVGLPRFAGRSHAAIMRAMASHVLQTSDMRSASRWLSAMSWVSEAGTDVFVEGTLGFVWKG